MGILYLRPYPEIAIALRNSQSLPGKLPQHLFCATGVHPCNAQHETCWVPPGAPASHMQAVCWHKITAEGGQQSSVRMWLWAHTWARTNLQHLWLTNSTSINGQGSAEWLISIINYRNLTGLWRKHLRWINLDTQWRKEENWLLWLMCSQSFCVLSTLDVFVISVKDWIPWWKTCYEIISR